MEREEATFGEYSRTEHIQQYYWTGAYRKNHCNYVANYIKKFCVNRRKKKMICWADDVDPLQVL